MVVVQTSARHRRTVGMPAFHGVQQSPLDTRPPPKELHFRQTVDLHTHDLKSVLGRYPLLTGRCHPSCAPLRPWRRPSPPLTPSAVHTRPPHRNDGPAIDVDRPHSHPTHGSSCPKTATPPPPPAYHAPHGRHPHPRRTGRLLPGPEGPRRPFRRPLLHRRHFHRHLLPPGVQRATAEARKLPLLCPCSARRERGFPALPALPPGAGARRATLVDPGCIRDAGTPGGPSAGRPRRLARYRWRAVGGGTGGPPGRERPAPAPHLRSHAGCQPLAVPADTPPAHRQTPARGHRPARGTSGNLQRVRQRAALQRCLCGALPPEPLTAAPCRRDAAAGRHARAPGLPAAVRRGRIRRIPAAPPGACGRGAHGRWRTVALCAHAARACRGALPHRLDPGAV